jgi:hypothetical protein
MKAPARRSLAQVDEAFAHGASRAGSTMWKRARRCPREHALYQSGLRRSQAKEALDFGILFHHALEVYYRTIQADQARLDEAGAPWDDAYYWGALDEAERAVWASLATFQGEPGYEETYERLETTLTHYFLTYRRRDRWRVLAVEETLEYAVDFVFTARLDLIVEDVDRTGLWIVEHKTTRAITDDLLSSYQLDLQILGQVFLVQQCVDTDALGVPFRGVMVDIATKHKVPRFERVEVCPSRDHLANFAQSMRDWNVLFDVWRDLGWPQALGNCAGATRFFKTCPYYAVCHGRPAVSVDDLMAEYANAGPPVGYHFAGDDEPEWEDET